jgi:SpoU rRNA methylase family enzyme
LRRPESQNARAAVPSVERVARETHGVRILVVEDIEDSREASRLMLERLGTEVFAGDNQP